MSELLKQHILVVEDHVDSANMLTRLLQRNGYEVSVAGNATDALDAAQSQENAGRPLDLLISDLGLPDASGYELMKKMSERHQIPGIALSGYGEADDVRRALEAGFSHHLTKPIDFDKLKAAIDDLLNQTTRPS